MRSLGVNHYLIQAILVPQGAEYQSVCRGLSRVKATSPKIVPIPVGTQALTRYLQTSPQVKELLQPSAKVLLMGLCGAMTPRHKIGDVVLYQDCLYSRNDSTLVQGCDRNFTAMLQDKLKQATLVTAYTSDWVIYSAQAKRHLHQLYSTDVVDMEGFAVLDFFAQAGVAVAMVRVVSDNANHDIPDLTSAFNSDGSLQPIPLAASMLRQPIAAWRLINGSLKGLQVLQAVTRQIVISSG